MVLGLAAVAAIQAIALAFIALLAARDRLADKRARRSEAATSPRHAPGQQP